MLFVRSFTSPVFGTITVAVPQTIRQIATIVTLSSEFIGVRSWDFSQSRAAKQSDSWQCSA
jgi:hypothetical protein